MERIKSHKLRGKRWKFDWRPIPIRKGSPVVFGSCDPPSSGDKTISVDPRWEGLELLGTIIHEAMHACLWDVDEDAIDQSSEDIARLLWRLGYREMDDL